MRMDAGRLEPRTLGELPQDEKCAGAGESATSGIEEELGPVAAVEMWPAECEIAADGLGGRTTQWH